MDILPDISRAKSIYPMKKEITDMGYTDTCDINSDYENVIISPIFKQRYEKEQQVTKNIINKVINFREMFIPHKYDGTTRVVTFNVHNFVSYCDKKLPKDINAFLSFFKYINADILCLQEMVPIKNIIQKEPMKTYEEISQLNFLYLVSEMKKIGYVDCIIGNAMNDSNILTDEACYYILCNGIFSKSKLQYKQNYKIIGNRSINIVISKDLTMFVNIHLEYSDKFKKIDNLRKKQLDQINKIIGKESMNNNIHNIVLCGDFNDNILESTLFEDLIKKYKTTKENIKTRPDYFPTDYILFSDSINDNNMLLRYVSIPSCLSDHFPVVLDYIDKNNANSNNYKQKCKIESLISQYDEARTLDKNYKTLEISDRMLNNSYVMLNQWFGLESQVKTIKVEIDSYYSIINNLAVTFPYYKNYLPICKLLGKQYIDLKSSELKKLLDTDKKNRAFIEDILLQYIKTRENMKTIVLWPSSKWDNSKDIKNLYKKLKEKGIIYYQKTISFNYYQARSLIYFLYIHTNRNKNMEAIQFHTNAKGWINKEDSFNIRVIFYEYTGDQKDISGSEAKFKNILRETLKTSDMDIFDILHINDTFQEALDNASMLLNYNSIKYLKKLNIGRLLMLNKKKKGQFNVFMVNTIKKILYNNFDLTDINRFIFNSSIILYTHAVREFNDVDSYVFTDNASKEFNKNFKIFFDHDSPDYYPTFDVLGPNTPKHEEFMAQFNNKIANVLYLDDYNQVIFNPLYHYYFFGLKMHILELEIIKRIYRFRPKPYADLIAMNTFLRCKIKFPVIPKQIKHYYRPTVNEAHILSNTKYYLKNIYNIDMTSEEIKEKYFIDQSISSDLDNYDIKHDQQVFNELLQIKCY